MPKKLKSRTLSSGENGGILQGSSWAVNRFGDHSYAAYTS